MENFSLLLLGLGLVLAGASESIKEIIKDNLAKEELQYVMSESGQVNQTMEVLMNLTLLDKNISFNMSKDVMPSSLLTLRRLHYNIPKGNRPGNGKVCCNDMTVWRKVLEVNESCRVSNSFFCGSMGVIHGVYNAPSCKCGQSPAISCCESPELENAMYQLTTGKQFPRCQYHSVTSLKKMLTVLTGHSLMSWLVSGSKL
ncbi:probable ribonuclease 11 [Castor canadensis]|jgi:ribonuclease 11|uniref:Probable ribonuclease 11 n=1 Tax=Castor canadensis TaxID=51338 RepID=A0A8C0WTL3_CASCN|nr:probable ribonuclease 11 [Castor canadensis]